MAEGRDLAAEAVEAAQQEAAHYRRLAEEAGRRRLQEAEALHALLVRAQEAERAVERARAELERRVQERTAELTAANQALSLEVAERQRVERALRASEEAFRSFMTHFPGLAWVKEADTKVVFANEGFRSLLGIDPALVRGRTNAEVFPPALATRFDEDDRRVLATGRPEEIEEVLDGRTWRTHKFAILRDDGPPRLGGLSLDVTEARRAEAERCRLERQMEQSQRLESLGVLAGGIAHDFNNLLTVILANLALLEGEPEGEEGADALLADARSAAQVAAGLCQQLLAYAGRTRAAVELVDLDALLRDMAQLLRASVSRGLGLELSLAGGLPPVRADPSQLKQVVMNLVINAAESMGDGGGTVTVATRIEQVDRHRLAAAVLGEGLAEGRYLVLEVTDTGCGMDPTTQRRIFEPFFSSKFAGRGLGLSAVLGIARQAGGAIDLTSAPGRGSRFAVLLPPAESAAVGLSAGPTPAAWRGSGLILVVDDEPMVRRAAGRLLRRLGFDVVEAPGGAEAIALFQRRPGHFRAVVLDVTMPDVDGVEVLQALRRLAPGARVVVASGHGQEAALARFLGDRPDGFVQKPFALEDLRAGLRAVLDPAGQG